MRDLIHAISGSETTQENLNLVSDTLFHLICTLVVSYTDSIEKSLLER